MKIAVSGAAGRMGKRILALIHENPNAQIGAALEAQGHPELGADAGQVAGIGSIGVEISGDVEKALEQCDVLIDFSSPAATLNHLKAAVENGKAMVIGTTGFSAEQKKEIESLGPRTRCLIAPNMSKGVNLLFSLVGTIARALGDAYDVEIVESHHKMKKDAPSGTAVKLAEIIAKSRELDIADVGVYGRQGVVGERKPQEIGVMALRGGDIVGEHTIMFVTNGERIEVTHRAHSRDALASGAVQAALWLASKPNGLYDMQDVLGLEAGK
jgi:4-hydroxy-tetrahydrodipicolinate reductase